MRLLYATDGSKGAQAAAELLAGLPLDPDCQLMLLTVAPPGDDDAARAALGAAREALSHSTASLTVHLRRGNPADVIIRVAEEHPVDLIVVGTRGLSGVERFFLGSVAERVARHAPCPVLLVRHGHTELHRVMVGVDGSEAAAQAVRWLQHFPLPEACEVRLVTALPSVAELLRAGMVALPGLGFPEAGAVAQQQEEEARARLDGLADSFLPAGARPAVEIRRGDPAVVLLHTARQTEVDLVVVGSHGAGGLERFLMGSVSEKVLRHADCSVLVVKPGVREPSLREASGRAAAVWCLEGAVR